MEAAAKLPKNLQDAMQRGVLRRLPLTFLPFANQQLRDWEYLFPNERQSNERLLLYVDSLSPEQSAALFSEVVQIENKMGIRQWQFSTDEQTIQNASELARSPYFKEWRQAVQAVFDATDKHVLETDAALLKPHNRVIVLDIPRNLPVEEAGTWRHWHGLGRRVKLEPLVSGASQSSLDSILVRLIGFAALAGQEQKSLLASPQASPADTWVIDGAKSLVEAFMAQEPSGPSRAVLLSYDRLDGYREDFSREMNSMRKNLANADSVFDDLRKVDVLPFCPPEIASDPAVREFVRALFLSGNGAVIFGNSFVEWAASEAVRRARPRFLAVRFGVRSKPKPFTSVAVFENPDQVNPLPSVDDLPGSAMDAQILAAYIWLSALRYQEYQRSTVCICLAESLSEAYLIAPPEFAFGQASEPLPVNLMAESLRSWIA
jgi:hypothetical protein